MSKSDNTLFILVRKRFATIGDAETILPIGLVKLCSSFFSSFDSAKSRPVLSFSPLMKNSSSVKIRPLGRFCVSVGLCFIMLFSYSVITG